MPTRAGDAALRSFWPAFQRWTGVVETPSSWAARIGPTTFGSWALAASVGRLALEDLPRRVDYQTVYNVPFTPVYRLRFSPDRLVAFIINCRS